jgi:uncharacterized protein (TIGR02757 family)
MPARRYRRALEYQYRTFNRRRFVHPDPLELVHGFDDPADQEVAALVASSLAYGRVRQILRSAGWVLGKMGPQPSRFLRDATPPRLAETFAGFRHRFTSDDELMAMLAAARGAVRRHGSLEACFRRALGRGDQTVLPALRALVGELGGCGTLNSLLPDPARGSACKRLLLMLRWMVRRDEVDPGPWRGVPARLLVVPLDTHMLRIARALGLTRRAAGDLRTALEVTRAFAAVSPDDPVRYDFSLTRLGIHPDARPCEFLARMAEA